MWTENTRPNTQSDVTLLCCDCLSLFLYLTHTHRRTHAHAAQTWCQHGPYFDLHTAEDKSTYTAACVTNSVCVTSHSHTHTASQADSVTLVSPKPRKRVYVRECVCVYVRRQTAVTLRQRAMNSTVIHSNPNYSPPTVLFSLPLWLSLSLSLFRFPFPPSLFLFSTLPPSLTLTSAFLTLILLHLTFPSLPHVFPVVVHSVSPVFPPVFIQAFDRVFFTKIQSDQSRLHPRHTPAPPVSLSSFKMTQRPSNVAP